MKYAELTGKDKEVATKLQREMIAAAKAEAEAKARGESAKAKYANLIGEPDAVVDIDGGKISCVEISPSYGSGKAVEELTAELPPNVIEVLQEAKVALTKSTLDALEKHPSETIRGYHGILSQRIKDYQQRLLNEAKAKGDGSHLQVKVTAPKS